MIIEDDLDIQSFLYDFLTEEGFAVQTANNGKDALKILADQSELPGVILLDLMMPVMDGDKFRRQQEKDPRIASIPVVVMTADRDPQIRSISLGAKGYLKKPFANLEEIVTQIARFFV